MKKLVKIALPVFLFICLYAALAVSSSAAGPANDSYYDLWVGGVAVNPSNEGDILGDGKVSFDPETRTLTLNGATINGFVSEYDYYLSVYYKGSGENKINVVIKGETKLKHGIRLGTGNVIVEDADLTFSSSAMTAFCLYGSDSSITLKNSTVKAYGSTRADAVCISLFYAKDITLQNTDLILSYAADAVSTEEEFGVMHATGKLSVTASDIRITQAIPTMPFALYANEGMTFTDSSVTLKAPMHAFYAPRGTVSFIRAEARVERGFFALQAAGLRMENASLEADVFYDGIRIAAAEVEEIPGDEDKVTVKPTEVLFSDSIVRVTQLGYSKLKSMLDELWSQMTDEVKLEYGNSKKNFLSKYQDDYDDATVFTSGFSGFCSSVSVLRSRVELKDFTLGYYATGTSTLYVSEGSELELEAERAAFVMFTNAPNAVTVSDKLRSSKDIYVTGVTGDLATLGGVLYTYSGRKPSIDLTKPYNEKTPEDLFRSLSRVSDTLHFYPANRIYLWIALGVGGGVLLLGGILTAILLIRRRRRTMAASKPSAKPKGKKTVGKKKRK